MRRLVDTLKIIRNNREFSVLFFCNLLAGVAYSFVGPFMSMFGTREVGMNPLTFSLYMTISTLGAIVLSTILSRWSDTLLSRKTVLLIGSWCGVVGYLGHAWVRDVLGLTLIGVIFLGTAAVTFSQLFAHAREIIVRSEMPASETPFFMNIFRLAFAISWTVGPAIAAWVMIQWGFEGTFTVAAGFFALLALTIHLFVPAMPPSEQTREAARQMSLRKALGDGRLLAHFLAFVLFFSCSTMAMMNLPLLILNELGGNESHVGIAYSLAPVFEIPFMFYLGVVASRMDHSHMIRMSLLLAVAYYALLSLTRAPWHVFPLQALSAAIVAVTAGVAITFFQNFLPDQPGTATNIYSSASRLGSLLGYLLFGALVSKVGHRGLFALCAAFSSVAFFILQLYRRAPRLVSL